MQTSSQLICLSWIQNAKVIVGYSFGRNVHFPSISDLFERPLLIVTFIIYSLKLFFPLMNCFIEQEKRAQIGGILLNLPIFSISIRFSGFWLYKKQYIFIIISDEKYRRKSSCLFCVVEIPFCVSPFHSSIKPVYIVLAFLIFYCYCLSHPFTINELFFSWLPAL